MPCYQRSAEPSSNVRILSVVPTPSREVPLPGVVVEAFEQRNAGMSQRRVFDIDDPRLDGDKHGAVPSRPRDDWREGTTGVAKTQQETPGLLGERGGMCPAVPHPRITRKRYIKRREVG